MPKKNFTVQEIQDYLHGGIYSPFNCRAVEMANEIAVHADGKFPEKLLRERRPNEPHEVNEYRCKVFEPITMPKFNKIESSLQKIRRSSEWVIRYKNENDFTKIRNEETLHKYCEENFPLDFSSVTNWVFAIQLQKNLVDPNAIVFVKPLEYDVAETDYVQPFPEIFDSCQEVDYLEGDYAVLKQPESCFYVDPEDEKTYMGDTYYFITTATIQKYEQTSKDGAYKEVENYEHHIGMLPAFKLKGIVKKQREKRLLYQSRLYGCIPEFNEGIREYSDLQGGKVNHMYPERWEYTGNECTNCKGTGRIKNPLWKPDCNCEIDFECSKCEGRGYRVSGPFAKMMVKPTNIIDGQTALPPMPPAGYIQKDIAIIELAEKSVERHLYNGLAAINFQFLEETPQNESGLAKSVDKDELNNFVHSLAEDIVAAMDKLYRIIARYRYWNLYNFEDIEKMLPVIPVPQTYDLLNVEYLSQELINAKKGNINPAILNMMEIELAEKRILDEQIRKAVELTLLLDPLANRSEADKILMLQNDGITQESYVISCNVNSFVQQAIEEDDNFINLSFEEQKQQMQKFAQQQIEVNKPSTQARQQLVDNNGNPIDDNGNI